MNSRATFPKKPKQNNLAPHGLATRGAFFCFSDGARTARGGATSTPRLYFVKAAACPLCGNGRILPNAPVAERRPLRGRQDPAFCLRPFHPSKKRNDWRCGLVFSALCVLGVFGGILIPPPFCFLRCRLAFSFAKMRMFGGKRLPSITAPPPRRCRWYSVEALTKLRFCMVTF